jgi:hypothetical protein
LFAEFVAVVQAGAALVAFLQPALQVFKVVFDFEDVSAFAAEVDDVV